MHLERRTPHEIPPRHYTGSEPGVSRIWGTAFHGANSGQRIDDEVLITGNDRRCLVLSCLFMVHDAVGVLQFAGCCTCRYGSAASRGLPLGAFSLSCSYVLSGDTTSPYELIESKAKFSLMATHSPNSGPCHANAAAYYVLASSRRNESRGADVHSMLPAHFFAGVSGTLTSSKLSWPTAFIV